MKRLTLIALLGITTFFSKAQGPEIGFWRDHLPYDELVGVVRDGSLIYAATPFSIFTYNVSDYSIEKLIKGVSISDIGISKLAYSESQRTIIVGYANGNVDLIKGNTTTNIPAIKTSSVSGDKQIYGVHCVDEWAYLATGFGIVLLDLVKMEVKDTYIIGNGGVYAKVNDVATDGTTIYAAMEDGIKEASLSNPFLSDYSQWTSRSGLPMAYPVSHMEIFNGDIFASFRNSGFNDDSVYVFTGTVWELDTNESANDIYQIHENSGKLVIVHRSTVSLCDGLNDRDEIFYNLGGNSFNAFDAHFDGSTTWIASEFNGLIRAASNWDTQTINPGGPFYTENYSFFTNSDGHIWVAGGTLFGNVGSNGFHRQGVYRFSNDYWWTYNQYTNSSPEFDSTGAFDYTYVLTDPSDPDHVFISSNCELGLIEMQNDVIVNLYNKSNSTLEEKTGATDIYDISQCHYDEDGNLWVISSRSTSPLSVKTPSGTWQGFSCLAVSNNTRLTNSIMDEDGVIWAVAINVGVLAYNTNNTATDPSDDQCKMLTTAMGSGGLPVAQVNCIAQDLDDEIWIGTESGPVVIYNPENAFGTGDYDAQQILIEQDGNVQILLETEAITSITIDGANRKWIGTRSSGAYLISEDGTEQILHFTEENSPLLSNEIRDIAVNGKTGEVFFGTLNGIISYKGTATEGKEEFSETYAYPNPVRPEFDGTIAIKGLLRDSDVKITDVSGNLVYETTSQGGQATWNGKTYDGEKVKSGVYLVFASSEDGSLAVVTKIAVIN